METQLYLYELILCITNHSPMWYLSLKFMLYQQSMLCIMGKAFKFNIIFCSAFLFISSPHLIVLTVLWKKSLISLTHLRGHIYILFQVFTLTQVILSHIHIHATCYKYAAMYVRVFMHAYSQEYINAYMCVNIYT